MFYYLIFNDFFMSLILFVVVIYCLIRVSSLQKQINTLTRGDSNLNTQSPNVASPSLIRNKPVPLYDDYRDIATRPPQPNTSFAPANLLDEAEYPLIDWLKKDFLVKLGALLLLLAFGWFVSYAFANNWIGSFGRIVLGIGAGIAFMLAGLYRIKAFRHQGEIFVVLGSTIAILTIFAAREMYDIFTPLSALLVMFLSIVFVAKVSLLYRSKSLALSSLILAAIAPFLTNAPQPEVLALFSYLSVIVLGTLWIQAKIDFIELQIAAFVTVLLYSLPYISGTYKNEDSLIALGFGFGFTVIFFLTNISSIMRRTDDETQSKHLLLAVGTTLYLASWIVNVVAPEWQSLLYVAWAIVFACGAFIVYMKTDKKAAFYIYGGVSVGLLGAATAAIFSGPILTLVYTIEVTVLALLSLTLLKNPHTTAKLCLLYVVPIILSLESITSSSWRLDGVLQADFFILVTLMLSLALVSYTLHQHNKENNISSTSVGVLAVLSASYALTLIWLITHAVFSYDQATTVSLIIYTLIGLTMYVVGQSTKNNLLQKGGLGIIGLVVVRLLMIDVWQMEVAGRIVTFLLIGLVLISSGFIKKLNQNNSN